MNSSLIGIIRVPPTPENNMRRGVGLSGLHNAKQMNASFKETGDALSTAQLEQLKVQFETFKAGLAKFAHRYQKEISQNPALRTHFTKMCSKIGVDPLISSKGFWTEMLGIGDFYYELAVQIVEICYSSRAETGGLLEMNILISKLKKIRGTSKPSEIITEEDVERAIRTLEPLGSGYSIIKLNSRILVQSVPLEFSQDQTIILRKASETGGLINSQLMKDQQGGSWTEERFESTLKALLAEGLVWVDEKTSTGSFDYWIASFFHGTTAV